MHYFSECMQVTHLTPQTAFLSYFSKGCKKKLFVKLVLLVFKFYIWKSRESGSLRCMLYLSTKIRNFAKEMVLDINKLLKG